jgi:hypothetical protein
MTRPSTRILFRGRLCSLEIPTTPLARSNDSAFLLRAPMPAAHAVCDSDADPASSKCLLESVEASGNGGLA